MPNDFVKRIMFLGLVWTVIETKLKMIKTGLSSTPNSNTFSLSHLSKVKELINGKYS